MKKHVILLTPLTGNGGIASWSKNYCKIFTSDTFDIIPIDRGFEHGSLINRIIVLLRVLRKVRRKKKAGIAIIHTTTSGGVFGTFRDYIVAKFFTDKHCKTIMHCHYGNVTEDIKKRFYGKFLHKTMALYDEIWVLDSRSEHTLQTFQNLKGKVCLIPNCIEVSENVDLSPKKYESIAFIGNLIPEKGLYELVEAVIGCNENITLYIVGKGMPAVEERLHKMIGLDKEGKIHLIGQLQNDKAVEFMKNVDMVALPSYMGKEAFPISILEAMSLGKLVISTHRAAISDMLTALDGSECGIFVREKSIDDIVHAIRYCVHNKSEADKICAKAYEKVYNAYRNEIVYLEYEKHYKKLSDTY